MSYGDRVKCIYSLTVGNRTMDSGGGGPGGWGSAIVIVPYRFWQMFGERDILCETYPAMEKWIGYLIAHSEDSVVLRCGKGLYRKSCEHKYICRQQQHPKLPR